MTEKRIANHESRITKTGFTLVELLLVVIILGALAAMIVPRLAGRSEQAKVAIAKADVTSNIPLALDLYELDNGRYPNSLQALQSNTGGGSNWNGPYIKKKPVDPWGNEYKYKCPPDHGRDYDLFSLGPNGVEGGDDVTNWED
ncbi:MAG: type II secretion system major pseudopilin GspG [Candidatus Omnitrophica bacterium]|nr:type II secretion system major pseudopilin GspG [Candidatus Omnitrophota bacterium]